MPLGRNPVGQFQGQGQAPGQRATQPPVMRDRRGNAYVAPGSAAQGTSTATSASAQSATAAPSSTETQVAKSTAASTGRRGASKKSRGVKLTPPLKSSAQAKTDTAEYQDRVRNTSELSNCGEDCDCKECKQHGKIKDEEGPTMKDDLDVANGMPSTASPSGTSTSAPSAPTPSASPAPTPSVPTSSPSMPRNCDGMPKGAAQPKRKPKKPPKEETRGLAAVAREESVTDEPADDHTANAASVLSPLGLVSEEAITELLNDVYNCGGPGGTKGPCPGEGRGGPGAGIGGGQPVGTPRRSQAARPTGKPDWHRTKKDMDSAEKTYRQTYASLKREGKGKEPDPKHPALKQARRNYVNARDLHFEASGANREMVQGGWEGKYGRKALREAVRSGRLSREAAGRAYASQLAGNVSEESQMFTPEDAHRLSVIALLRSRAAGAPDEVLNTLNEYIVSPTSNANPEGCNQYKPCAETASAATRAAFKEKDEPRKAHFKAAQAHRAAAGEAYKAGNSDLFKHHEKMAGRHMQTYQSRRKMGREEAQMKQRGKENKAGYQQARAQMEYEARAGKTAAGIHKALQAPGKAAQWVAARLGSKRAQEGERVDRKASEYEGRIRARGKVAMGKSPKERYFLGLNAEQLLEAAVAHGEAAAWHDEESAVVNASASSATLHAKASEAHRQAAAAFILVSNYSEEDWDDCQDECGEDDNDCVLDCLGDTTDNAEGEDEGYTEEDGEGDNESDSGEDMDEDEESMEENCDSGMEKTMNRRQMVAALAVNCTCEGDKAALNALSNETLLRLLRNTMGATGSPEDAEDVGGYAEDDENPGESEEGEEVASAPEDAEGKDKGDKPLMAGDKKMAANVQRYLRNAPPELRDVLTNSLELDRRARAEIVLQLTNNRQRQREYMRLPLKRLEAMLHDAREFAANHGSRQALFQPTLLRQPALPTYLGAAGGVEGVTSNVNDKDDVLLMPSIDYKELAAEHATGRR